MTLVVNCSLFHTDLDLFNSLEYENILATLIYFIFLYINLQRKSFPWMIYRNDTHCDMLELPSVTLLFIQ